MPGETGTGLVPPLEAGARVVRVRIGGWPPPCSSMEATPVTVAPIRLAAASALARASSIAACSAAAWNALASSSEKFGP